VIGPINTVGGCDPAAAGAADATPANANAAATQSGRRNRGSDVTI
jgi:hypothetical protein